MPRLVPVTAVLMFGATVHAASVWAQPPLREFRPSPAGTGNAWPQFTNPPAATDYPTAGSFPATTPLAAAPIEGESFELAETVAQVGDQYILKGELIGDANLILAPAFAQIEKYPPEERERARQELTATREQLMKEMLLKQAIERKLKYLEFLRALPSESDPKKADERLKKIHAQATKRSGEILDEVVGKVFNAKPDEYPELQRQSPQLFRLALVMKEANIRSREDPELDRLLKSLQTSFAKQQQAFVEHMIGQSAMQQKVNFQPEITHAQMVTYYREHVAEYQVQTRAQWEQLTVLFQRFPNEEAAWNAICEMWNEVYWGGTAFWAVAKRKSQEKNATNGGFHDWTNIGDLKVSQPVNDAVFSYDLNALSPIIRDDKGFHIIRVTDRQIARVKPFTEVQSDIKEKLRLEYLNKTYNEYVAKLWKRTPVIYAEGFGPPASRMAKPTLPQSPNNLR